MAMWTTNTADTDLQVVLTRTAVTYIVSSSHSLKVTDCSNYAWKPALASTGPTICLCVVGVGGTSHRKALPLTFNKQRRPPVSSSTGPMLIMMILWVHMDYK